MTTTATDVTLLITRVGVGGALFAHGAQKLFGWFGGGGPEGTGAYFESIGIKPGKHSALASGIAEAGGGAALVLGLGTPAAAAAVAGNMGVASTQHIPNGFFNSDGGFEFPVLLGVLATGLAIGGPGKISVDHLFGDVFTKPWMRAIAVISIAPAIATIVTLQRRASAAAGDPVVADGNDEETYS
ncbi:MAG: mhqP3 [Glaciihabitans sp.]|nr:mhqP3 [Glaciihabitans sp.]